MRLLRHFIPRNDKPEKSPICHCDRSAAISHQSQKNKKKKTLLIKNKAFH